MEIGGSRVHDVSDTWQGDEHSAWSSPQEAQRRRFSTLRRSPHETFTRFASVSDSVEVSAGLITCEKF